MSTTTLVRGRLGETVARPDGIPKVTGEFAYSSDLNVPGMLHGATLRSPHAHARILSIDIAAALKLPGVHAVLTHDDVKGLPGLQQQGPASAGLPPNSAQAAAAQQHAQSAQAGAQPQPAGGQGPQQGYPPPMPYYNPYPQSQYYGTPYNYGYGVPQPFVKYPTMFQPGPPAPGSARGSSRSAPAPATPRTCGAVTPTTTPTPPGMT